MVASIAGWEGAVVIGQVVTGARRGINFFCPTLLLVRRAMSKVAVKSDQVSVRQWAVVAGKVQLDREERETGM